MSDLPPVYFAVSGYQESADAITALMGVEPTQVWQAGDTYSQSFPEARRRENRWILDSGLGETAPFKAHFSSLLDLLEKHADGVQAVLQKYPAGIAVSTFYFESNPNFFIDEDMVKRFSALGLSVTFDQMGFTDNS